MEGHVYSNSRVDFASSLFDGSGRRKYLAGDECRRFLLSADGADPKTRILCYLLAFTGCRISEALALTPQQLDVETQRVVFRTLKRRKITFRAVPVPVSLLDE